ncbi:hypothetical protein [Streptomyces solincola]|uniref:hypothetical protein n=1 Tax=Streptomyces solincola TaxID=2100817 RepID=UPI0011B1F922|nr:hypothetical protein [Streptomyces solincola]
MESGLSQAGAVSVPLYRQTDVDNLPAARPQADRPALRPVDKRRRSLLAALRASGRSHSYRPAGQDGSPAD